MTALLVEAPAVVRTAVPTRTTRRTPSRTPSRPSSATSCAGVGRRHLRLVGGTELAPERLYWTRRGLAVALALVGLVVGLMAVTLVSAFLAVSNEPLPAAAPTALAAVRPAEGSVR